MLLLRLSKVKGKGKYSGSLKKQFTISPRSLTAKDISLKLKQTSFNYDKKAKTPGCTVTDKIKGATVTLKNKTDYTIKYQSNKEPGTGKLIVTGKDNYKGTISGTFKINKLSQPAKLKQSTFTTQYDKVGTTVKPVILDKKESAKITYSSSNTKVATVKDGVVTIKGTGSAAIKISLAATKHYKASTLNYTVNVLKKQAITTGIKDGDKIAYTTNPVSLKAAVKTGNGKLSYKSSDTNIVKVDSKGNLIFKDATKLGTATITITASKTSTYAKATKTIKITTVKGKPVLNCEQTTLDHDSQDEPFSLSVSVNEPVKLVYSSDKPECAAVSADGIVTLNPDNIKDDLSVNITVQSKANAFFKESDKITLKLALKVKPSWKKRMEEFIKLDVYKDGATWGTNNYPLISNADCGWCRAYAADFVAYVYGLRNKKSDPITTPYDSYADANGGIKRDITEIRAGDVVCDQANDNHVFVVLDINWNTGEMLTAEGNVGNSPNAKVRIGNYYRVVKDPDDTYHLEELYKSGWVKQIFNFTRHYGNVD